MTVAPVLSAETSKWLSISGSTFLLKDCNLIVNKVRSEMAWRRTVISLLAWYSWKYKQNWSANLVWVLCSALNFGKSEEVAHSASMHPSHHTSASAVSVSVLAQLVALFRISPSKKLAFEAIQAITTFTSRSFAFPWLSAYLLLFLQRCLLDFAFWMCYFGPSFSPFSFILLASRLPALSSGLVLFRTGLHYSA